MRIFISTGEVSGDFQASLLIKSLYLEAKKRSVNLDVVGLGGPRMRNAGASIIADTTSIAAIGLFEALPQVLPTLQTQRKVDNYLKLNPPDLVILIDYMGPNIRLGNKLRSLNKDLPIIYYIAPQEWAWSLGKGGTTDLIGFSNMILAIFKMEADFYKERGGNVFWVGHPLIDSYKSLPERSEALDKLGIESNKKVLLLFPASRPQEIKYLMPSLLKAALKLQKLDPSLYVLIPAGLREFEDSLNNSLIDFGVNGKIISAQNIDYLKPFLFSAAELALCKSGTINMELALNNVPQIVGYKVSRGTAFIAKKILRFKVDHISPVNLLLKERLIPELVQDEFTDESIFELAMDLLKNEYSRNKMILGYKRLRDSLGESGVTERAAIKIFELIGK